MPPLNAVPCAATMIFPKPPRQHRPRCAALFLRTTPCRAPAPLAGRPVERPRCSDRAVAEQSHLTDVSPRRPMVELCHSITASLSVSSSRVSPTATSDWSTVAVTLSTRSCSLLHHHSAGLFLPEQQLAIKLLLHHGRSRLNSVTMVNLCPSRHPAVLIIRRRQQLHHHFPVHRGTLTCPCP